MRGYCSEWSGSGRANLAESLVSALELCEIQHLAQPRQSRWGFGHNFAGPLLNGSERP